MYIVQVEEAVTEQHPGDRCRAPLSAGPAGTSGALSGPDSGHQSRSGPTHHLSAAPPGEFISVNCLLQGLQMIEDKLCCPATLTFYYYKHTGELSEVGWLCGSNPARAILHLVLTVVLILTTLLGKCVKPDSERGLPGV